MGLNFNHLSPMDSLKPNCKKNHCKVIPNYNLSGGKGIFQAICMSLRMVIMKGMISGISAPSTSPIQDRQIFISYVHRTYLRGVFDDNSGIITCCSP